MRSLMFALPLLIAAAPASAQSLKAAIDAQNAKWVQDFSSGNAAALAQLYTPQAHVLPAGALMATGRAEIQKMYQSMVQSGHQELLVANGQSPELRPGRPRDRPFRGRCAGRQRRHHPCRGQICRHMEARAGRLDARYRHMEYG